MLNFELFNKGFGETLEEKTSWGEWQDIIFEMEDYG